MWFVALAAVLDSDTHCLILGRYSLYRFQKFGHEGKCLVIGKYWAINK